MTPNQIVTEINRLIADRDNGNESAQTEIDRLAAEYDAHPEVVGAATEDFAAFDLMMARFG